jgi:tRNA (mo5U34)-methyltransferase
MTEIRSLPAESVAELAADSAFVRNFRPRLSPEQTREAVAGVGYWYHSTYLGHGLVTVGNRDTFALLRTLQLPESLAGKTVLDIGSADGFFSFECEARGAARVSALDLAEYRARFRTIRILKDVFASSVELVEGDVGDPGTLDATGADVVLFLGVLYHLMDPFLVLRRLRKITRHVLYLESHVVNLPLPRLPPFGDDDPPIAVFYDQDQLAGDSSNWWGPNLSCLLSMLRAAGFERAEVLLQPAGTDWNARAVVRAEVIPGTQVHA